MVNIKVNGEILLTPILRINIDCLKVLIVIGIQNKPINDVTIAIAVGTTETDLSNPNKLQALLITNIYKIEKINNIPGPNIDFQK